MNILRKFREGYDQRSLKLARGREIQRCVDIVNQAEIPVYVRQAAHDGNDTLYLFLEAHKDYAGREMHEFLAKELAKLLDRTVVVDRTGDELKLLYAAIPLQFAEQAQ